MSYLWLNVNLKCCILFFINITNMLLYNYYMNSLQVDLFLAELIKRVNYL